MTQQSAAAYIRHGQTPFFRLPLADISAGGTDAYRGADAVLLGVPFDGGVTFRPGARFAPWELRRVSAMVQTFHPQHRIDVFAGVRALDGGNVMIPPFAPAMVRELVQAEVASVLAANAVPFIVGGDHSIALPALRAVAAKHGPLAVVHLDAHLDTSTAEVWSEPFHHGTPFRHALTEGLIERGQLHQVGIRATWGDADEGALVAAHETQTWTPERIADEGIAKVAAKIARSIGDRPVYISLDIDGIDPAFAPGTGTPVPGGLSALEGLRLLRGLAGCRLAALDLVEVCPALDHADITLHLGAHLLYEGLALLALRAR